MISLDRPALSTVTRWKFMGRAFDYGVLMRQKAISFVGTTTANTIAAGRRPRTTLMPSSRAAPSSAADRDQYRRAVAICTVAGVDLAEWLVKNGVALDWPKYSKGNYAAAQDEAKRAERGIWSGSFVEPWRYRACRRTGGSPASCSDQP
jgi:hypothetical protein